jgi:hypothetical protein
LGFARAERFQLQGIRGAILAGTVGLRIASSGLALVAVRIKVRQQSVEPYPAIGRAPRGLPAVV